MWSDMANLELLLHNRIAAGFAQGKVINACKIHHVPRKVFRAVSNGVEGRQSLGRAIFRLRGLPKKHMW